MKMRTAGNKNIANNSIQTDELTGLQGAVVAGTESGGDSTVAVKQEILVWIFTLLSALGVYIIIALIIEHVYHPDIEALKNAAEKLIINDGRLRPEPVESMLFQLGVADITVGLAAFYLFFSKVTFIRALAERSVFFVFSMASVLFIALLFYFDFAATNPFGPDAGDVVQCSRDKLGGSNFHFFFDGLFLGNYLWLYTFIGVPLLACLFFLGFKKYNWEQRGIYKKGIAIVTYAGLAVVIAAIVAMSTFNFPYSFENKYNFNAVYYSMTQVHAGAPMLVDGFTNTYGLYPQFLNLLFHFTGLSVLNFSFVMALLTGAAFVMNFYSLKYFIRNKVILLFGMLTVIFFPYMDFKLGQTFDCNFAVYPIRYLIPSVLIFLATVYLKKSTRFIYWLTTAIMAIFVLWNPEIGVVCYLAWLAFNTFRDFYSPEGKVAVKKILYHWVAGAAVLVTVCFAYKGLIYLVYGAAPDLSLLFGTMLVFGRLGFNLLPMSLVHPWNIVALIVILGFLYAVARWHRKSVTPRAAMVFMVSVLGVGYFFYFQGRSHNWQLAQSSCMSLFLLTLLGDELWYKIKKASIPALNVLFVVFLAVISFSFFEFIFDAGKTNDLVYQEEDKQNDATAIKVVGENKDFILNNSAENEKIYVFAANLHQALYFDGSKRRSAFNPGQMDMFLETDNERLENQLTDSSFNAFISPGVCTYGSRQLSALAANYEYAGAGSGTDVAMLGDKKILVKMFLLKKIAKGMPDISYFLRQGQLIHRKYNAGAADMKKRINDAQGITQVRLSTSFSVEALFKATEQVYPFSVLVGNMADTKGFVIHRTINSPDLYFAVNGLILHGPAPKDQWCYCVLNVFPDHFEVYVNGVLCGTSAMSEPVKQSEGQLFIGNLGENSYYVGAISEVAINNYTLDKSQVEKTWNDMK